MWSKSGDPNNNTHFHPSVLTCLRKIQYSTLTKCSKNIFNTKPISNWLLFWFFFHCFIYTTIEFPKVKENKISSDFPAYQDVYRFFFKFWNDFRHILKRLFLDIPSVLTSFWGSNGEKTRKVKIEKILKFQIREHWKWLKISSHWRALKTINWKINR